jgi:hypothetical protein
MLFTFVYFLILFSSLHDLTKDTQFPKLKSDLKWNAIQKKLEKSKTTKGGLRVQFSPISSSYMINFFVFSGFVFSALFFTKENQISKLKSDPYEAQIKTWKI